MTAIDLLRQEKQELLKRLSEINNALDSLMGESKTIKWTERALKCIKDRGMLSLSPDILKCLFKDNLDLLDDPKIKNNYMTGLSIALRNMVSHGILIKVQRPGIKGYFYGLPEWLDEQGNTIDKYDIDDYTLNVIWHETTDLDDKIKQVPELVRRNTAGDFDPDKEFEK